LAAAYIRAAFDHRVLNYIAQCSKKCFDLDNSNGKNWAYQATNQIVKYYQHIIRSNNKKNVSTSIRILEPLFQNESHRLISCFHILYQRDIEIRSSHPRFHELQTALQLNNDDLQLSTSDWPIAFPRNFTGNTSFTALYLPHPIKIMQTELFL
jgi:hypothetical protein